MSAATRRSVGTAILVVGWSIVLSGAVIVVTALAGHSPGRDQRGGDGIALIMAGLMVVLAGNYVHHRARRAEADAEPSSTGGATGSR